MTIDKKTSIHPSKGIVIRFKGTFDMDSLYKSIKSWYGIHSYNYYENENTEKTKPQGNSLQLKMNGEREVDDYVKFRVEVEFNEVMRVKKLAKGNTGDARIIIKAFMILDYKNNWKRLPFLFYIYNNIILKKKILVYYWQSIYDEMMELNSTIKSELGLIK